MFPQTSDGACAGQKGLLAMLNGLYRGTVSNNVDPENLCRLQVSVPEISQDTIQWAMPCAAIGGAKDLGAVMIPPVGANVWIMFEKGKREFPVWLGTFWDSANPPPGSNEVERIFKTPGLTMVLSEAAASPTLALSLSTGESITLGSGRIIISNGRGAVLLMEGPTLTINNGAFTVT